MLEQDTVKPTDQSSGGADPVTTAAVAASAAVAATQPFLQVNVILLFNFTRKFVTIQGAGNEVYFFVFFSWNYF